jgi:hypothetical protein
MSERDFIIHKLERPRVGELLLVHDIGTEALEKLASGVRRLSRDGQPKDAAAVYAAINRFSPDRILANDNMTNSTPAASKSAPECFTVIHERATRAFRRWRR